MVGDAPVFHMHHAVGEFEDARIVRNDENATLGVEHVLAHELQDHAAGVAVQRCGGFVENEQLWITHQRPGDRHTLLFAAAEFHRWQIGAVFQTDDLQRLRAFRHGLVPIFLAQHQRNSDVLRRGQARKQMKILEYEADRTQTKFSQVVRAHLPKACAVDNDRPRGRSQNAGDHAEQRGLSTTGRPDDEQYFPVTRLKAGIAHSQRDRIAMAERFGEAGSLDGGVFHAATLESRRALAFEGNQLTGHAHVRCDALQPAPTRAIQPSRHVLQHAILWRILLPQSQHRAHTGINVRMALSPSPAPTTGQLAHVLVVDDDAEIAHILSRYFSSNGFRVSTAGDGTQMRSVLNGEQVDLVMLDLGLPGEDGLTLTRHLREHWHGPVIIVTGRGESVDRVVGLELGADDYVTKPFDLRELLARVRSVLRRASPAPVKRAATTESKRFVFDEYVLDAQSHSLFGPQGEAIALTSGEFALLRVFVEHASQVLTRDQLMTHIHGRDAGPFDRSIDVQIGRLRRKIEADPANPQRIKSIRGVGYLFSPNVRRL